MNNDTPFLNTQGLTLLGMATFVPVEYSTESREISAYIPERLNV